MKTKGWSRQIKDRRGLALKGPFQIYITAKGERESTIVLYIVTYILRGEGVFHEIVT